jgi:uncharacterized protein (UPF0261 family)
MSKVAISASAATSAIGGLTSPCVEEVCRLLSAAGREVLVFPATGVGGRELESFVGSKQCSGLVDLTTTELAEALVGGLYSAGPDRMIAAATHGVSQVVAPGGLDIVNLGPMDTLTARFRGRRIFESRPGWILMRTTPEENDKLGREIALKMSASRGPAAVLLPLRGLSCLDVDGQPFWWPEADAALFQSIRNWISPHVRLVELDLHFNDSAFAQNAVDLLLQMSGNGT